MSPPQQTRLSPVPSELVVGVVPAAPVEMLASPVPRERETCPQTRDTVDGALMPDQCVEVSPPLSDPEDTPIISPTPPLQDAETAANFSPPTSAPIGLAGPEGSVPHRPPLQYQRSHQITKALFAPKQQIQPPVSQVQVPVPQPAADSAVQQHNHHSESQLSPQSFSSVPPSLTFTGSSVVAPEPPAALETKSTALAPDAGPAGQDDQGHPPPAPLEVR